ncbi:Major Facilitator Superfamily protein [Marinibacterium anthonyi]|nr:Major Facilitator Superfamily protein [Marinibacterium anthonyi]
MMTAPRIPFLVLLLWIAGLCAAGQFAKIAVPFAEFRALYPGAGGNVGWLLSVISLLGALFGAFAGALVGVTGPVRMLVGGLLAGGVISLLQSGIPGFSVMLASRVIEGLAHLAIVVAAPTLIARITPERWRGASMALWSTFFGVAFALVAWAGRAWARCLPCTGR